MSFPVLCCVFCSSLAGYGGHTVARGSHVLSLLLNLIPLRLLSKQNFTVINPRAGLSFNSTMFYVFYFLHTVKYEI